jgi:hypothetical protein
MRGRFLLAILGPGLAAMLVLPSVSTAATTVNGNFETGTFAGWTVYNQVLSPGSGDWFVYSGTTSPLSGSTIAAPPEGTFAATTDQSGPGTHILYQDVTLEPGFNHTLSFVLYYANRAGRFATPVESCYLPGCADSLHWLALPNQQYRVDIMKPTADPLSVAASDVLATVFRTNVGDPLTKAPTSMSFDLSAFAGTTVRLRFAEVENQGPFQASVDKVAVTSIPLPTTAEQCENGGWRSFGTSFNSQGDCVSFVASNGKNEPGKNQPH